MEIEEALRKRGWTGYRLAQEMAGQPTSSIYNALSGRADKEKLELRTAIAICQALWPDVQLADLLPSSPFELRVIPGREIDLG